VVKDDFRLHLAKKPPNQVIPRLSTRRRFKHVLHVDKQDQARGGPCAAQQGDSPAPEWAKKQLATGVLVQAGKWGDHGGMIIIKAGTREEADRVVNQDPLVKADLVTFETAELHAAAAFK
jgi:hypothetical protein